VEDLKKGCHTSSWRCFHGTLLPVLTGGKEPTEMSQPRGSKDLQNPESPIVHPTWRRKKPVKGKNAGTTQDLRHLKGSCFTSGKKLH
jgi:hypothetical protein